MRDLTRELVRLSVAIEQPNYLLPEDAAAIKAVVEELEKYRNPPAPTSTNSQPADGSYVLKFGCHEGKQLDEVPLQYLDWLLGLSWLEGSTRMAICRYLADPAIAAELGKEIGE